MRACVQERINEVENTRLEYNKARQNVGVAHKAAVKLASKKDATNIEENPGVIQANAVLTGGASNPRLVISLFGGDIPFTQSLGPPGLNRM